MITLHVNGKRVDLDQPVALLAYLDRLGVDARSVAVEHNGVILKRERYAASTLRNGDKVEIVRMVGGGAQTPHDN